MKLETLSLKGVLRFHEPVSLDFRDLPPGLIAFTGENGAGKTTLMESPIASMYRYFPSRERELFDYATRTDAYLETTFVLDGRGLYRTRVNIDGPHRKTEAILAHTEADGTVRILNDGKVSTFDAVIKETLPCLDDILASVFAAQNRRGSFSALDRKGKRELFASLLGLDHIEALAERARQAVARVSLEVDRLSGRVEILARSVTAEIESSLEQRAQQLQVAAGSVDARRVELTRLIADAERVLVDYREAVNLHAKALADVRQHDAEYRSLTTAHNGLVAALSRLEVDYTDAKRRLTVQFELATSRFETDEKDTSVYATEITNVETRRQTVLDDVVKRIAANDELKASANQIRGAVARLDGIKAGLATIDEKRSERAEQLATAQKRERVLLDALAAIREQQMALERAERDAAAIEQAPFKEDCAPCMFMTSAATARANIAGLREAVGSKATAEAELVEVLRQIKDVQTFIAACDSDTTELRREQIEKEKVAADLPNLAAAEARIKGHEKRREDAEADAVRDRAAAAHRRDQRILRLRTEQATRTEEYTSAIEILDEDTLRRRAELSTSATDRLADLQRFAKALSDAQERVTLHAEPAGKAEEQEAILAGYRREWIQTTETRATVAAQVDELRRAREAFAAARADYDATSARLTDLQRDLVEWQVLAKALGREGLQTLEIDAAGPVVSAFANDLLQSCYGGRFSLEMITQAPKTTKGKDGSTTKEVFEASVYDQARGGERRDLSDLSGGERVIVEEILRSAIALLVNSKNSQPMRTLWRDETTGALDPKNAERYIAMLRRIQQIGGFHQILFVTHNEDCARLADAQVQVADGAIAIALPPYLRAEVAA